MNKGVTPHNYQLRRRSGPTLLRPSDFTPSTSVSTPKPTAPTDLNDLVTIPTTSLLLETAASTYTSPVILVVYGGTVGTMGTNIKNMDFVP
ncbi:hypothetical protein ACJMK2_033215 [Sinanodonta woodiana]|uniref:Uncharacterized protein n=1 Tax=Sinanodonta woodiana TaxID=1069815 RepID=A0ABD3X4C1_SINWO